MPLTQKQARDNYIIDSIAKFLDRNIKAKYDTEVGLTAGTSEDISSKLRIRLGNPTDPAIVLNPPVIALSERPAATNDDFYAIGSAIKWRHLNLDLFCFPSIRADGYPSDVAAFLLKSYMRDVFSTESIRVLDYSNPTFTAANQVYTGENLYIVHRSNPADHGKKSTNASEVNRFDMTLKVKYAVIESLAT